MIYQYFLNLSIGNFEKYQTAVRPQRDNMAIQVTLEVDPNQFY